MNDGAEPTFRIDGRELRAYVSALFERSGLPAPDAEVVADSLVEADLRGVHSHGVVRVPYYVERLRQGGANPTPQIRTLRQGDGFAVLDGDNGMGQVVSARGIRLAIEKARRAGTGWVVCRRSSHFGAAAYWAMQAVPERMIGYAATNSLATLFAWGGATPLFGNNPLAYAVPAGRHPPVVLDMAMSVAAHGKIEILRKQGKPVPDGWMLDAEGLPTRDPDARAHGGAMVPIGGPKGVGLALLLDILCGVLAGASFAGRFPPHGAGTPYGAAPDVPFDNGHLFMAVDIERFMPFEEFTARMEELVETVHASRLAPGVERVYLPGEIEHEQRATRLASGIPLLRSVIEAVEAVGNELGAGRLRPAELNEETTDE